uniref:Uncharacterized protein n=1 Tax=Panagrolaimus sp. JU765 TaxID=591449 RepID=A0AC34Q224_9BILA
MEFVVQQICPISAQMGEPTLGHRVSQPSIVKINLETLTLASMDFVVLAQTQINVPMEELILAKLARHFSSAHNLGAMLVVSTVFVALPLQLVIAQMEELIWV